MPPQTELPSTRLLPSDIQVQEDPAFRALDGLAAGWAREQERAKRPGTWAARTIAQYTALNSEAFLLLLGGAAGSLKTSTMLVDAIKYRDYSNMRSYFFRRTYRELEGGGSAIDQAYKIFPGTGGVYNASSHTWRWPSGAEAYFRHCQYEKDVYSYQSQAMSGLYIDEATHWPEKMLRYLLTRVRTTDISIKPVVRWGTNPGGIGHKTLKDLFFKGVCPHCHPDQAPPQAALRYDARWPSDNVPLSLDGVPRSVSYILSYVTDHDLLGPEYIANLKMQSPATAKGLLEGCWDIFEGQFFDCFRRSMVVSRKSLREEWWWPRWVASDYGFSISIGASHLLLHQPASPGFPRGRVIVADEYGCQETAREFARLILKRWMLDASGKPIERRWMPWYLSPDSFSEDGQPFSLASQMNEELRKYGLHFNRANNDRQGGAMKLYTGISDEEIVICEECKNTIDALESRIHDPDNENDVLKVHGDPLDDYYDSCRYGVMSFETARKVAPPPEVAVAQKMEEMWKQDPTWAMMQASNLIEKERAKARPTVYGGSARQRMADEAKRRR